MDMRFPSPRRAQGSPFQFQKKKPKGKTAACGRYPALSCRCAIIADKVVLVCRISCVGASAQGPGSGARIACMEEEGKCVHVERHRQTDSWTRDSDAECVGAAAGENLTRTASSGVLCSV